MRTLAYCVAPSTTVELFEVTKATVALTAPFENAGLAFNGGYTAGDRNDALPCKMSAWWGSAAATVTLNPP